MYLTEGILNTHNEVRGKFPRININDYPAIKTHLDQYYPQLAKRADKGDTPYNLRNCAYLEEFKSEKIVYNDITQRLSFGLVGGDIFFNNTAYFISHSEYNLYFLAILNSRIIDWYYRQISAQLGTKAVRMFSIYVRNIPIPRADITERQKLSKLMARILELKKEKSQADTSALEAEIDKQVFDLYNLSVEEISFV